MYWIPLIFVLYNVMAFFLFIVEEYRQANGFPGDRSRALLWVAILGGGPGAWLAMRVFGALSDEYIFRRWLPRLAVLDFLLLGLAMWIHFDLTHPKCPYCGSRDAAYVIYGKNTLKRDNVREDIYTGDKVIGELHIGRDNARYQCKKCNAKFGRRE